MKTKYLLTLLAASTVLVAGCNSGSSSSTPVNEDQTLSVTMMDGLAIGYVANNCRIISPNGTCKLNLAYQSADSSSTGKTVGLTLPNGYTGSTSACPTTATTVQTCIVTISASSTANTKTQSTGAVLVDGVPVLGLSEAGVVVPLTFALGDSNN